MDHLLGKGLQLDEEKEIEFEGMLHEAQDELSLNKPRERLQEILPDPIPLGRIEENRKQGIRNLVKLTVRNRQEIDDIVSEWLSSRQNCAYYWAIIFST